MNENTNNCDYKNCPIGDQIVELIKRVDKMENSNDTIKDSVSNVKEASSGQNEIIKSMIEDRKDTKETNKKIFNILDEFSKAFGEIKIEMVLSKETRLTSAKEIDDIRTDVTKVKNEMLEIKNTPAKNALEKSQQFKRILITALISTSTGIFITYIIAELLKINFK